MSIQNYFKRFNYYAQPEGHDPFNKIVGCSKYGALFGIYCGSFDVLLYSKTKTVMDSLRCVGFWTVPLTGMCAAFASTTYIATNVRGKDDPLNYVIGALAAGGVLNAWSKCFLTTLYGTMFLSLIAALKKDSIDSGWTFYPTHEIEAEFKYPFYATAKSKEKKYERGWTT